MEAPKIREEFNGQIVDSRLVKICDEEYYISEYGNIYSKKRGSLRKLTKTKDGSTQLQIKNKAVSGRWDKLSMKSFKASEKEGKFVKFIDGNVENTHYSNLEWTDTFPTYYTTNENKVMKIEEVVMIDNKYTVMEVEIRYFGYDGYYISEYGTPYSIKTKKLLPMKVHKRKSGFDCVDIKTNGKNNVIETSIAVAKAFIPIEKELPYVLFKDDNILNKHYTNLYWSESAEKEDGEFQILLGFSSYKFNRHGVCKSYKGKYPKIMRFSRDENGYFFLNIVNDKGERVKVRRNRAVATIFIPNPENKPEVDHGNKNRGDDRVENLSWVTECENSANIDYEARAEKMYKRIGKFSKEGDFIEEYKNCYVAAAILNTEDFINIPYSIRACAKKNNDLAETEKHFTSHGYIWKIYE
jgi:hypothetical protein